MNTHQDKKAPHQTPLIYREVAFDLASFNRLKEEQRKLQGRLERAVTNSEALCSLISRTPK